MTVTGVYAVRSALSPAVRREMGRINAALQPKAVGVRSVPRERKRVAEERERKAPRPSSS